MAKRVKRSARRFYGKVRRHTNRFTAVKGLKLAIALGIPASVIIGDFQKGGVKKALDTLTKVYTGFSQEDEPHFDPKRLAIGWAPLVGAWAFGKFASRILRM